MSVAANPSCPDEATAERAVNEVFDSCFNDTRPFDEVSITHFPVMMAALTRTYMFADILGRWERVILSSLSRCCCKKRLLAQRRGRLEALAYNITLLSLYIPRIMTRTSVTAETHVLDLVAVTG